MRMLHVVPNLQIPNYPDRLETSKDNICYTPVLVNMSEFQVDRLIDLVVYSRTDVREK